MLKNNPLLTGGSSDIGNVSHGDTWVIHPSLSIVSSEVDIPGHSHEFALAAKSELAKIAMIKGTQALAMCGSDLLGNFEILHAVQEEFPRQRAIKKAV